MESGAFFSEEKTRDFLSCSWCESSGASRHRSPPPQAEVLKALEFDPLQHLENLRRVKVEQSFRGR